MSESKPTPKPGTMARPVAITSSLLTPVCGFCEEMPKLVAVWTLHLCPECGTCFKVTFVSPSETAWMWSQTAMEAQ